MKASKAAKVARTRSPLGTAPVERAEPRPDPQWWRSPVAVVLVPLVFYPLFGWNAVLQAEKGH